MKNELLEFIKTEKNIAIDFLEKAKNYHGDIYLYGAGYHLPFVVGFMRKYGIPIKAILDSSKPSGFFRTPYQGSDDGDIPIINFSDFVSENVVRRDCWFVISAPSAKESIRKNIMQYYPQNCIFSFETVLYTVYFSLYDIESYRTYLLAHWAELTELYDTLSDDKSRETLVSVLKGRLSGNLSYFRECCVPNQYFSEDVVRFSVGEVMVELGAYNGETLLEFTRYCPDFRRAYCFEPDRNLLPNLNVIQERLGSQGKDIVIIPKGAWDQTSTLKLSDDGTATATTHVLNDQKSEGGYTIEAVAIDDAVQEPVSYVKMDIEGSELRALHGMERHIVEDHPKLAVCVYHKNEDILNIWNYLRSLVPEYQFYLRHHTVAGDETVLYAIP